MTPLFHLYRQSTEMSAKPSRLIYGAVEAVASPDIADTGETLNTEGKKFERAEVALADHHFDDAKIKALNLLTKVDEALKGHAFMVQGEVLKTELAQEIHTDFHELHEEYEAHLRDTLNAAGLQSLEAQEIHKALQARAWEYIHKIEARVDPTAVQEYAEIRGMLDNSQPGELRNAARVRILEARFKALRLPPNVQGLAREMASVIEENPQWELEEDIDSETKLPDLAKTKEWFEKNGELIGEAVKRLVERTPKYDDNEEDENQAFSKLLLASSKKYAPSLAANIGSDALPQVIEALALRFHTEKVGDHTYYVDMQDPSGVYTEKTIGAAVEEMVGSKMLNPERVPAELARLKKQAEEWNEGRADISESFEFGPAYTAFLAGNFNDKIDSLEELMGKNDPEKAEFLGRAFQLANAVETNLTQTDVAYRAEVAQEHKVAADKAQEAAEFSARIGKYKKARDTLVGENNRVSGFSFEVKNLDGATVDSAKEDIITIKKDNAVVATIRTTLDGLFPSTLTIEGAPPFTKNYDNMNVLQAALSNHSNVTDIRDLIIKNNQEKLKSLIAENGLWKPNTENRQKIGDSNLYLEDPLALMNKVQPAEHFKVDVPLFKGNGNKAQVIGHVRIDFTNAASPQTNVVLADGTEMPAKSRLTPGALRAQLDINPQALLEKVDAANKNREAVAAVRKAIVKGLPKGFTSKDSPEPANFTDTQQEASFGVLNANGAEVAIVNINVATRKINLTSSAGPLEGKGVKEVNLFLANDVKTLENKTPDAEFAIAKAPGLNPEFAPTRAKILELARASFPLLSQELINDPKTQLALDRVLTRLGQEFPDRLETLQKGDNFKLTPAESLMIVAEFEELIGPNNLDVVDNNEMKLVNKLELDSNSATTFEAIFKANHPVAQMLSRKYVISAATSPDTGIILSDSGGAHPVLHLNTLEQFLPEAKKADFRKVIDPATNEGGRVVTLARLTGHATEMNGALEQWKGFKDQVARGNIKESMKQVGLVEAASALFQLWQAVAAAMQSNPPDFTMANEILTMVTNRPPRNPSEVLRKNQLNFEAILAKNQPAQADQHAHINRVLAAYVRPKGTEADTLFGNEPAKKANIKNPTDIADLALMRSAAKPIIAKYLGEQLGLAEVKIRKDNNVTKVAGYRDGTGYEIHFAGGKATVYTGEVKEGKGTEVAIVNFKKIQEAFSTGTAVAGAAPEVQVQTATELSWKKGDVKPKAVFEMAKTAGLGDKYVKEYKAQKAEADKDAVAWCTKWIEKNQLPNDVKLAAAMAKREGEIS